MYDKWIKFVTKDAARYRNKTRREASEHQRKLVKRTGQALVLAISITSSTMTFIKFGISWSAIVIVTLSFFCSSRF